MIPAVAELLFQRELHIQIYGAIIFEPKKKGGRFGCRSCRFRMTWI